MNKNRQVQTAMTRLRIGHVGLQQHMHRFNMTEEELCSCREAEESVEHFLLHCNTYLTIRNEMLVELGKIKVNPTLQNILGGGNFDQPLQNNIVKIVAKFLQDTGKLAKL